MQTRNELYASIVSLVLVEFVKKAQ